MKISIIGCGWLGTQIASALKTRGAAITVSAASAAGFRTLEELGLATVRCTLPDDIPPELFEADTLLLLFNPFWRNNPESVSKIISALRKHLNPRQRILYSSSTGVYQPGGVVNEQSPTRLEPYYRSLVQFESFVLEYPHSMVLRLAGLVGPGRNPGRWLSGKEVKHPDCPVNLIHSLDIVKFFEQRLLNGAFDREIYNLCAPEHPTRFTFYSEFARKAQLPLPGAGAGAGAGADNSNCKQICSNKLISKYRFKFRYPDPCLFPVDT